MEHPKQIEKRHQQEAMKEQSFPTFALPFVFQFSFFCRFFSNVFTGKRSAVDRCLALLDVDWDVLTQQVIKGALWFDMGWMLNS